MISALDQHVPRPPLLTTARAVLLYGGQVARAIQRLKYEGAAHLARPLGRLMHGEIMDRIAQIDLILPVPLHPRRLVSRGYNQAGLLASEAARGAAVPVCHGRLRRIRHTAAQTGLSKGERRANVQGAFRASGMSGARVLLVDDVATTHCTASACALALLEAGARQVHLLTLARAMP